MKRLLIPSLLAIVGQAQASLPPCVTDGLIRDAVTVVQIVDQNVTPLGTNFCSLSGTIAASHRGAEEIGRTFSTTFSCLTDPAAVSIGATVYSDLEVVRDAGALEVHINVDGFIAGNGAGLIVLEAPTTTIAWKPYCDT